MASARKPRRLSHATLGIALGLASHGAAIETRNVEVQACVPPTGSPTRCIGPAGWCWIREEALGLVGSESPRDAADLSLDGRPSRVVDGIHRWEARTFADIERGSFTEKLVLRGDLHTPTKNCVLGGILVECDLNHQLRPRSVWRKESGPDGQGSWKKLKGLWPQPPKTRPLCGTPNQDYHVELSPEISFMRRLTARLGWGGASRQWELWAQSVRHENPDPFFVYGPVVSEWQLYRGCETLEVHPAQLLWWGMPSKVAALNLDAPLGPYHMIVAQDASLRFSEPREFKNLKPGRAWALGPVAALFEHAFSSTPGNGRARFKVEASGARRPTEVVFRDQAGIEFLSVSWSNPDGNLEVGLAGVCSAGATYRGTLTIAATVGSANGEEASAAHLVLTDERSQGQPTEPRTDGAGQVAHRAPAHSGYRPHIIWERSRTKWHAPSVNPGVLAHSLPLAAQASVVLAAEIEVRVSLEKIGGVYSDHSDRFASPDRVLWSARAADDAACSNEAAGFINRGVRHPPALRVPFGECAGAILLEGRSFARGKALDARLIRVSNVGIQVPERGPQRDRLRRGLVATMPGAGAGENEAHTNEIIDRLLDEDRVLPALDLADATSPAPLPLSDPGGPYYAHAGEPMVLTTALVQPEMKYTWRFAGSPEQLGPQATFVFDTVGEARVALEVSPVHRAPTSEVPTAKNFATVFVLPPRTPPPVRPPSPEPGPSELSPTPSNLSTPLPGARPSPDPTPATGSPVPVHLTAPSRPTPSATPTSQGADPADSASARTADGVLGKPGGPNQVTDRLPDCTTGQCLWAALLAVVALIAVWRWARRPRTPPASDR